MADKKEQQEKLLGCPICGTYLRKNEGFTCPKCRRGPFCKTHRVPGERACPGCVLEIRSKEITALKTQLKSLKGFSLFLQFFFLVFAILYVADKIGFREYMELSIFYVIVEYSLYIGLIALLGSLVFYILLRAQRSRIIDLESQMSEIRSLRWREWALTVKETNSCSNDFGIINNSCNKNLRGMDSVRKDRDKDCYYLFRW